jgi:hypothetical protein
MTASDQAAIRLDPTSTTTTTGRLDRGARFFLHGLGRGELFERAIEHAQIEK